MKLITTAALLFSSCLCMPLYAADASETADVNATNLPGGYSDISTTNANVAQAAEFAVEAMNKGRLNRIVSAQSQVVAGMNYKMQLELIDASGNTHTYNVVVFMPLPVSNQPMQLKSVQEVTDTSTQLQNNLN